MKPYSAGQDKKEQIRTMFDGIAPRYDLLNHLLSFGIDKGWRRKLVKKVRTGLVDKQVVQTGSMASENRRLKILDLATGTGDLAILLARKVPACDITGADLSPGMLEIGAAKASKRGLSDRITFTETEAESMPFEDETFDAVTIAFGIRNFHDIPASLREIERVLAPGGTLYVLEFSTPDSKLFGALYRLYFHRVLPWIGGIISRDMDAYRYLPGSVDEFPSPEDFRSMIESAALSDCRIETLTFGVARIHSGTKPKGSADYTAN